RLVPVERPDHHAAGAHVQQHPVGRLAGDRRGLHPAHRPVLHRLPHHRRAAALDGARWRGGRCHPFHPATGRTRVNPTASIENLAALRKRVALSTQFGWLVVSGVTATLFREKSEKALNDVWSSLMSAEQTARFRDALVKLGI